jgi:hypothetical protein
MDAGLWHETTQDDDLLAKDGISARTAARERKDMARLMWKIGEDADLQCYVSPSGKRLCIPLRPRR